MNLYDTFYPLEPYSNKIFSNSAPDFQAPWLLLEQKSFAFISWALCEISLEQRNSMIRRLDDYVCSSEIERDLPPFKRKKTTMCLVYIILFRAKSFTI